MSGIRCVDENGLMRGEVVGGPRSNSEEILICHEVNTRADEALQGYADIMVGC